jgi:hypothetical protein
MTTNNQANGHTFTVDDKSMKIGGVLLGVGGLIFLGGAALCSYALFDAASRWVDELEQPPSAYAMNTIAQAKAATAAGIRAWLDQQEQQGQAQLPRQQQRKQPTTLRA